MERYIPLIKDIDFIFHEYSISNIKVQNKLFSFFDFFIPNLKKDKFFFKKSKFLKLKNIDSF